MSTDRRAAQTTVTEADSESRERSEVTSRDEPPRPPKIAQLEGDSAPIETSALRERSAETWSMDESTVRYGGVPGEPDDTVPPYELLAMTRRTPTGIAWKSVFGEKPRGARPPPPPPPKKALAARHERVTPPSGLLRGIRKPPIPSAPVDLQPELEPDDEPEENKVEAPRGESTQRVLNETLARRTLLEKRRALVIAGAIVLAIAVVVSAIAVRAARESAPRPRASLAASSP